MYVPHVPSINHHNVENCLNPSLLVLYYIGIGTKKKSHKSQNYLTHKSLSLSLSLSFTSLEPSKKLEIKALGDLHGVTIDLGLNML